MLNGQEKKGILPHNGFQGRSCKTKCSKAPHFHDRQRQLPGSSASTEVERNYNFGLKYFFFATPKLWIQTKANNVSQKSPYSFGLDVVASVETYKQA